ncbi:4-hydroxybenzoate 3-monooxygenase [Gryllotalpicola ginsengisoli]|uniref:4-hydroxybenzoate 3-monooxygenase n=1 Tax=Gryllotalpicola ginsengisoli TaxID=444608 RepID=UPI0003B660FA|nr:4-hydroxybenzoate 3-monooxygenase [Gryllotalpicola ginsengisoli]
MSTTRTQVAVIGAGPAGLLLSWSLRAAGIDSVVIENRSLEHILGRIRAGILEQCSVEELTRLGLGDGIAEHGLTHHGIHLQFDGQRHHVDFHALIGRTVTVYGQQAVVADLVRAHREAGSEIVFEASDVSLHELTTDAPRVRYVAGGAETELTADFVVGADGFHGVSRPSIPGLTTYQRGYPYAWLGILADVAPSTDELIYCLHERGFAMHSMRSPEVSRLYLQVPNDERIENWPDARIWDELQTRLGVPGWTLHEGPITDKSITPMRSFVSARLRHGRLFLAGDAGHIVPPTGAKGLNAAIADVTLLARGLADHYAGDDGRLEAYESEALGRQWKVQQFSQWMTELLHRAPADDDSAEFQYRSQLGRLAYVTGSRHAMESLAEQYSGLPL